MLYLEKRAKENALNEMAAEKKAKEKERAAKKEERAAKENALKEKDRLAAILKKAGIDPDKT